MWQAWHLATFTVTLRGRRRTWRHRPSLCAAGVLGWLSRAWFPFDAVDAAAVCVAGVALGDLHGKRGTWRHRSSLCVAGMALGDIHHHFAWQAWHLVTSTVTLHGRRETYRIGLALVARLVPVCRCGPAALCVAGVALGDIHRHFPWQEWRLVTSTVTLRGRRGTYGTGLALVTRLVPVCRRGRRGTLRGRRGTW